MPNQLDRIFRIWSLLRPLGVVLLVTSLAHFVLRIIHPFFFLLPNDPAAWLMLATSILFILAGTSLGFKDRVLRLVQRAVVWVHQRRKRQG